jgi:thiol-disulfide isomerase/thioredoxin
MTNRSCKWYSYFAIGIVLLLCFEKMSAQGGKAQAITRLSLKTIHNKGFYFNSMKTPCVAIVFLSPDCPLCRNYTRTLNSLQQQYVAKLTVVGVFPGHAYADEDYLKFNSKYAVAFPLIKDEEKELTHMMGASITPEVFLLNERRELVYSGAIDNWAVSLGKSRKTTTANYLRDAVEEVLSGRSIKTDFVKAVGCYINDN